MRPVRAEYAAAILHGFVAAGQPPTTTVPRYTPEEREARAGKLREQMHALLDKGEQPTGYRAEGCARLLATSSSFFRRSRSSSTPSTKTTLPRSGTCSIFLRRRRATSRSR